MTGWHLLIDRDDLRRTTVVAAPATELSDGQARLRIDAFGLTANNVSYGAAGDMLGYWTFFPAPDTDDGVNWGRVPVWGFSEVVESRCDGVEVGERLFGYHPMSTELVIEPTDPTPAMVTDGSPHRAALSPVYNQLVRCANDPAYDPAHEDMQMLLRILFMTSFMLVDFLAANDLFGGDACVLTSASSKTSFGTAHLLQQRDGIDVIGITSPSNVDFVTGLGCYDRVVIYDEIASLPEAHPILLDFAGNAAVVRAVHERYGDELRHSAIIGATHWENRTGSSDPLPGPPQEFFFVPTYLEQRRADWGVGEPERRMGEAWPAFVADASGWVAIDHHTGADAIASVWDDLVEGGTSPNRAAVLHPTG